MNPVPLTIRTSSAEKAYDGTPLTSPEITVEGLQGSDAISVTALGSRTDPGAADNTCEIHWGNTDPNNYVVTQELGTLTVTVNTDPVTFTAASAEKVYDGTPLFDTSVTASGLPDGFSFTAEVESSQTDAGESDNIVSAYAILNAEGADVTENFTNIATVNGLLTVYPAPVTIATESAGKPYDGLPLTAPAAIIGLVDGETVDLTATGAITNVGMADNTYEIVWSGANPENYDLTEEIGTLEVTINTDPVVFTAASAEKVYNGVPLTSAEVTVEGLPEGVTFEAETSGSQTDAGTSENTVDSYKILDAESQDVTEYFSNVTTVAGTLTVQHQSVTIITSSAEKVFDGTPLIGSAVITGLTS